MPNKIGHSYTDFLASWTAQLAVMAALIHRAKSGRGMWIDLAMYQVGVSFLGDGLLDYAFNGRSTRRLGNRHQAISPHGCYRCRGEDQWVTLAVRDDSEWDAFCRAMELPDLATDPCFALPLVRHRNQDRLDEIITARTSTHDAYQVMEVLQMHGIPAGPALNARQLMADPHFRQRDFFETVDHAADSGPQDPGLGQREYVGSGWKLASAGVTARSGAPRLGEANDYVLGELLGLDSEEIQNLDGQGIIGTRPVNDSIPGAVPLADQLKLGWIAGYDANYRSGSGHSDSQ